MRCLPADVHILLPLWACCAMWRRVQLPGADLDAEEPAAQGHADRHCKHSRSLCFYLIAPFGNRRVDRPSTSTDQQTAAHPIIPPPVQATSTLASKPYYSYYYLTPSPPMQAASLPSSQERASAALLAAGWSDDVALAVSSLLEPDPIRRMPLVCAQVRVIVAKPLIGGP